MVAITYEELPEYLSGDKDFIVELGEQSGIGSSSLLIRKCGKTGLIDRGVSFEGFGIGKTTTLPAGGNLEGIHLDYIVFTHVHADHFALIIPTLLAHPESRVFFSQMTFEEGKVMLEDTLKINMRTIQQAYHNKLPAPAPLFTEADLYNFYSRVQDGWYYIFDTDEENVWHDFEDWPGWDFGFTFSGHTKGAFITAIKYPDGDAIVLTGDVSGHDQETTRGVKTIDERFLQMAELRNCKRIILVTEATNGDRDRTESQEAMDARLKEVLQETERRGGQALFPVFMVNRGPNIVAKLVRLGFKVFVAGGVRNTLALEVGRETVAKWRADGTVMFIENGPNYMTMLRSATKGEYGFRPIVTSSATLDQGAGVEFAIHMLSSPENVLISTGHRFDGSTMQEFFQIKDQPIQLGRTIVLNQMRDGKPVGTAVNVRCRGEHFDYSAHSHRGELVELANSIRPDMVFVKHCTESGFEGFKSAFQAIAGDWIPVERAKHLHICHL